MTALGKLISRRAIVALMARSAFGLSALALSARFSRATAPAGTGEFSDPGIPSLATLIRDLFPHGQLDDGFYRDMALGVWDRAKASKDVLEQLRAGMAELDRRAGAAGWTGADRDTRHAVLADLENQPFFKDVHTAAAELIYRDPRVWDLIGYGGNALAGGGYLQRGFNDIDWLPAEKAP
ncbi:MAG: hypothetical protein ACREUU_16070 [Gammaproteobacteria bacterium]